MIIYLYIYYNKVGGTPVTAMLSCCKINYDLMTMKWNETKMDSLEWNLICEWKQFVKATQLVTGMQYNG